MSQEPIEISNILYVKTGYFFRPGRRTLKPEVLGDPG